MHDTRADADGWRVPARQLENLVVTVMLAFLRDGGRLLSKLELPEMGPLQLRNLVAKALVLADQLEAAPLDAQRTLLAQIIDRIDLATGTLILKLDRATLLRSLDVERSTLSAGEPIELNVPISNRRRGVETKFIIGSGSGASHRSPPDAALIDMVAKPHQWLASLASGDATSINDIAGQQGVHPSDITRALPLAFLAPDIVTAILDGRHPVELTANRLKLMYPLPADWTEQRRFLGFPQPASL